MKTLSLLLLATALTAFSGMAHAENLFVNNMYRGMNGIQFTVIEPNGDVKDSLCLQPNSMAYLTNYDFKNVYTILVEVKEGYGCEGGSINLLKTQFYLRGAGDVQADINNNEIMIHPHY